MTYYIGIFGSAFDPPTLGHKDVIEQAASMCNEIILVPCIRHAFEKKPLIFSQRLLLVQAFLVDLSELPCHVEMSTIEQTLLDRFPESPVYTYNVLEALETSLLPGKEKSELVFIRGPDNARPDVWKRFYKSREIEQRWQLFTAKERLPVRSTRVRNILSNMKAEDTGGQLSILLSPHVLQCILEQNLYRS